jgi:hypothetical protein
MSHPSVMDLIVKIKDNAAENKKSTLGKDCPQE